MLFFDNWFHIIVKSKELRWKMKRAVYEIHKE
jgi:hypothetical protein